MVNGVYITQGRPLNQLDYQVAKTHKEIVRIMVFSLPCQKDGQATSNTKARAPLPGFSRVIWDEWGKKGVRMDTKALKKQMGAAIAMVLVAAVALGSATFAWFVSNNSVNATSSKISAQSNSAFMYIYDENNTSATKTDQRADSSSVGDTPLYPAHWANGSDTTPYDTLASFYTAFGTSATDGTKENDTVNLVPAQGANEAGTPAAAVAGKYAVKNTFKVGSKGAALENLVVKHASIKDTETGNEKFDSALRVLVMSGKNWVLCSKDGIVSSSDTTHKIADTVSDQETTVDMYVFYDGDDAQVFTNNLANLTSASKRINVVFDATSTQTDKNN